MARNKGTKNGRKYIPKAERTSLTANQPNTFKRSVLLRNIPAVVTTSGRYVGVDDNGNPITPISVSGDISESPVEIFRAYDENGNPFPVPVDIVRNGRTVQVVADAVTNNDARAVAVEDAAFYAMMGKTFTHNHPIGVSFSIDDIIIAQEGRFAGTEARVNRTSFWNSIQSFNANQSTIVRALEKVRQDEINAGLKDSVPIIESMMALVMQTPYNSSRPSVAFQATPNASNRWPATMHKKYRIWYDAKYQKLAFKLGSMPEFAGLSSDAMTLLVSHGLMSGLSEKAGFNYSVTGV
jgi:hypothetical protein